MIQRCPRRLAQAAEAARSRRDNRNPASAVIPAQAGIQWLNKPFPQRGNANSRNDYPMRHPLKPIAIHYRILAFLDSGLRRNDDEAIDADWQPYCLNPCRRPVIYRYAYRDVRLHGCRW